MVCNRHEPVKCPHKSDNQFVKLAKVQVIGESRRPSLVEFWIPLTTPTPPVDTKSILHGPPQTASHNLSMSQQLGFKTQTFKPCMSMSLIDVCGESEDVHHLVLRAITEIQNWHGQFNSGTFSKSVKKGDIHPPVWVPMLCILIPVVEDLCIPRNDQVMMPCWFIGTPCPPPPFSTQDKVDMDSCVSPQNVLIWKP